MSNDDWVADVKRWVQKRQPVDQEMPASRRDEPITAVPAAQCAVPSDGGLGRPFAASDFGSPECR